MQQKSRSKVSVLPLLLFIVIPAVAFIVFRKVGFLFFAVFFNPIAYVVGQLFRVYKIENDTFIIKGLFTKTEIPIEKIRYVETKKTTWYQKLLVGFPETYQIVGYNTYDDIQITPRKELIFSPNTSQLYFKN